MGLSKLLNGKQTVAVLCYQFGDSGKGKITDFLAEWADVIARGTGGNNAGHTVVVNGIERIYHLLTSGISYDGEGKTNILGNGMVIDLDVLCAELDDLDNFGMSYNNLMVSRDAHVILPFQIDRDQAKNKSLKDGGIGSTGRGIGPCYTDKTARRGVRIADLYDKDMLVKKIEKLKPFYSEFDISIDDVISKLQGPAERISPHVRDTVNEIHRFMRAGKKIVLEGAQGHLLSIEHGIYPYVTSSDCSLNGTASGVGLSAKAIDLPLGLIKFPFMSRVGGGPFPTELGGEKSDLYCQDFEAHTREYELEAAGVPYTIEDGKASYNNKHVNIFKMVNSKDPFVKGKGIRLAAGEFGATTGRPRRVGWTDAVAARYAVMMNGPDLVLTKPDSLSGADEFSLCFGYDHYGLVEGEHITEFIRDSDSLRSVEPVLKTYKGYQDISDVREYSALPNSLRESIDDLERFTGGNVRVVSVGPERSQTILR